MGEARGSAPITVANGVDRAANYSRTSGVFHR
jgi:hypothetical protein